MSEKFFYTYHSLGGGVGGSGMALPSIPAQFDYLLGKVDASILGCASNSSGGSVMARDFKSRPYIAFTRTFPLLAYLPLTSNN
jgi:hypothetical protein